MKYCRLISIFKVEKKKIQVFPEYNNEINIRECYQGDTNSDGGFKR